MKKLLLILTPIVLLAIASTAYFLFLRPPPGPKPYISLAQARADHQTKLHTAIKFDAVAPPAIRHPKLDFTSYQGPLGEMHAIATPDKQDGIRKPAIVYLPGGFGGIQYGFDIRNHPSHDLSVVSYLEHDVVFFIPSLRGEHGNPGTFECFYGEVDDIIAALEHVKQRPDVDPEQIYLVGFAEGGTNALLTVCMTDIPKQVIVFGACVNLKWYIETYGGYDGREPFDTDDWLEVRLRSAVHFTRDIKAPTLYIEGEHSPHTWHGEYMWGMAQDLETPYRATIIPGALSTNYLRPIKDMITARIANNQPMPEEHEIIDEYRDYFTRTSP